MLCKDVYCNNTDAVTSMGWQVDILDMTEPLQKYIPATGGQQWCWILQSSYCPAIPANASTKCLRHQCSHSNTSENYQGLVQSETKCCSIWMRICLLLNAYHSIHQIGINLIYPLKKSTNGIEYICTVTDYFTEWTKAPVIQDKRASTIAHLEHLFLRHVYDYCWIQRYFSISPCISKNHYIRSSTQIQQLCCQESTLYAAWLEQCLWLLHVVCDFHWNLDSQRYLHVQYLNLGTSWSQIMYSRFIHSELSLTDIIL